MAGMRIVSTSEVPAPNSEGPTGPRTHWGGGNPAPRQPSGAARTSQSDPARERLPRTTGRRPQPVQRPGRDRRPLVLALLLSLVMHVLVLNLKFGGEELGLPGLAFPWRDRRIEAPALRIELIPARATAAGPAVKSVAEPSQRAAIEAPVAVRPTSAPTVSPALQPRGLAVANAPAAEPTAQADAARNAVAIETAAKAPLRTKGPDRSEPVQIPAPAVSDVDPSGGSSSAVRAAPFSPTTVIAVAPSVSSPETVTSASQVPGDVAQEAQKQEAPRQEAARPEAARLEAEHQEGARQAAQLEAQQQEPARQEAARLEAARLEAERQDVARQAATQLEAQQQEAARQEAARTEAARLEAERQEAVRQAAARQEAARALAEKEEDARREARRRAMGRQLDEEAARREAAAIAARSPSTLPLSLSTARRFRLWGRSDPNVEVVRYAEAWALKIQFNTAVETVREVAKLQHTPPMVTVAIRSDGSVESVTFEVSSGVAEVDEAIRRIVEGQRPYEAFPPALAREFDVIEIRRTWSFRDAVRLY
jgi:hypothetical protein